MSQNHTFSTDLNPSKSEIDRTNNPEIPVGVPYPLGCVQWFPNDMIISAGGGGPSRTGIANGFEILQFTENEKKQTFELCRHSWYNTRGDIVYCLRQHPKYPYQLIAGIANTLVVIEIRQRFEPSQKAFSFNYKQMNRIVNTDINSPISTIICKDNIESIELPNEEDPFCVMTVAIHPSGKFIACGGTDGIVKIWKYCFITTALEMIQSINITNEHYSYLQKEKQTNNAPPEIERLLFDHSNGDQSEYLSICNREHACYIWNIKKKKMQIILMDNKKALNYIFRDCAFVSTNNNNNYCICAVNTKRRSKKDRYANSYLYQYYISNNEWYRVNYCTVYKAEVMRMISCPITHNVITLHTTGVCCVLDGLNLTKLYSFEIDGTFFMDIALSPNYRYLLIALLNDVIIRPIKLKKCSHKRTDTSYIYHSFCNFKCCTILLSVIILAIAIIVGSVQGFTDNSFIY